MKRDAWYAAIAALGLSAAAGTYAFIAAPELADPEVSLGRPKLTASLPSPPGDVVDMGVLATAQTILKQRDPFTARSSDEADGGRGLDLPKLGPPVRFSNPDEQATVTVERPAALQPQAAAPQAPVPQQPIAQTQPAQPPTQGSLTLRGVYPTPQGGRALVALPNGQVVRVGVGGVVGGWRVLEIQQGAIKIARGQRAILLAMPR